MADNKVNFLRGTSAEYESSIKDNDTFYYTTDTKKLYLGGTEITGIEIDDTSTTATDKTWSAKKISEHSGNAEIHVTAAEKASWNNKAELSDIPTTLPANGGNAETVGGKALSQIMTSDGLFTGDLDELKVQCSVLAQDCTNAPENAAYWGTVCVYIGGTGSVVQIFAETTLNPNELTKVFIRHFTGHFWSPWKNIADCGNATTLETHPASDFALKTNIPTTLPANGGRSDTASHQIDHILGTGTDILKYAASDDCPHNVNTKVRIMHSPTCPTNYGYNAADNDFWYDIYKLDNLWVTVKAYDIRGNVEYINSRINGTWSGWARCNDNGNATSANYAGSVSTTLSNNCLRNISAGTTDLSAGVSELATGAIYLVYE